MFIYRKIQGTVIDFDRCIEIYPNSEYRSYDEYRHLELCSQLDDYFERYESRHNELFYVYHNVVVEYDIKNETQKIVFPKVYYQIRIEKTQPIVMCFNRITKEVSIANGFLV